MPLPSTGSISFNAIQTEFGGTNPILLSEYRRGAGEVYSHGLNSSIPTTNSNISMSQFRGASQNFVTTITSGSGTLVAPWGIAGGSAVGYSTATGANFGSSTQTQIGLGAFSTSSTTLKVLATQTVTPPKSGSTDYILLVVTGDQTAWTGWSYVQTPGGTQYTRASASVAYDATNNITRYSWVATATWGGTCTLASA